MHEVFNDMECEALADTFIARRERDSVAPPPRDELSGINRSKPVYDWYSGRAC